MTHACAYICSKKNGYTGGKQISIVGKLRVGGSDMATAGESPCNYISARQTDLAKGAKKDNSYTSASFRNRICTVHNYDKFPSYVQGYV